MLAELREAVAIGAFEAREPFDEARHLNVGIRFPGGEELSTLVLVDHLAGMQLADAFVLGTPVGELRRATANQADLTIGATGPAEIHRLLDDAIWSAYHTLPPPTTETWPDCAILVEWAASKLPDPPPTRTGNR